MKHSITRRNFLKLVGAGAALLPGLKGVPVHARTGGRRILVIVELNGGNDGLNTLVPYTNGTYFDARPNLALDPASILPFSDTLGLHPSLGALQGSWDQGNMNVVSGLGYPDPDLSHFRSTDIWRGADTAAVIHSGWLGRYLEYRYGTDAFNPSPHPYAIELRDFSTLLTRGDEQNMGMTVRDPENAYQLTSSVIRMTRTAGLPAPGVTELTYVQAVDAQAAAYTEAIYQVYMSVLNQVAYPETSLASDLAAVARMIAGGMETTVYAVELASFDTHVNQATDHAVLLETVAGAIEAFLNDLKLLGVSDEVLVMTMSEFGRRLEDNGSGTDHGTAAPQFMFGDMVSGGFSGEMSDLSRLDASGNLVHTTDFRSLYATVLRSWFGLDEGETSAILKGAFPVLPGILL